MSLTASQRQVFAVTWITYAGFYFCRKNLSVVLPLLHGISGLGNLQLANIVFGYSLLYALGQFVFGFLSDRVGAKRVVFGGLLLAIACNGLMGIHASYMWMLLLACLNGVGQSTGWSGLVKIMARWFNPESRGTVMAWWGTNYVFGGFLATSFATWSIAQSWFFPQLGWRRGFLFPAIVLLIIAILFQSGIGSSTTGFSRAAISEQDDSRSNWNELIGLLRKPALWMVAISYFFLELCRYALMFWLPLYMVEKLNYSLRTSGYISSLYELVGIVGAILAGYISDRFVQSRRAPVAAIMLCGLGVVMFAQGEFPSSGFVGTAVAISLAGMLSYGPDTLLSGAAAQDIGEAKAAATVSGLVEGIGHLGALFSPYLVVRVSARYGWDRLFLIFAGAAFLAAAVLVPMWRLKPADSEDDTFRREAIEQTV